MLRGIDRSRISSASAAILIVMMVLHAFVAPAGADEPPMMRETIPQVVIPETGGRYETNIVPDTCNLVERQRLFIGFMAGMDTTTATITGVDVCTWPKYRESLPLARIMTGSRRDPAMDRRLAESLLHMVGPDGLIYQRGEVLFAQDDQPSTGSERIEDFYAYLPTGSGRILGVLTVYYLMTGDEMWNETARGIVDRLNELAIRVGDEAFYPKFVYRPNERLNPKEIEEAIEERYKLQNEERRRNLPLYQTWIITGLAQYYGATRYESARELAEQLIHYMRKLEYIEGWDSHFHCISLGIHAAVELAFATGDRELAEYARVAYEKGKALESSIPALGYFARYDGSSMEGCSVADMTAIAVKLARMGGDSYWDDVERFARNGLIESQVTRPDQAPKVGLFSQYVRPTHVLKSYHGDEAEDWRMSLGACCTGNATRALYYVWEAIVDHSPDAVTVNLLLNRVSPWADVNSYLPYEGRIEIRMKGTNRLKVRLSEWIDRQAVRCNVDGKPTAFDWEGVYADVGEVRKGSRVTFTFPIEERVEIIDRPLLKYRITFRGYDAVAVERLGNVSTPAGFPNFQREHYRNGRTRYKKQIQFVSDTIIDY